MDTNQLSTWLAIIAISSALQVLLLIGAVVAMLSFYKRTMAAVTAFERERLAPVVARVNSVIDDVHNVMDDVHEVVERVKTADDQVRHALSRTAERATHTAARVASNIWPAIGLGRGIFAAVRAFTARRQTLPGNSRTSRAVLEGGTHHVRS